jgi:hypothetical protein
MHDIIIGLFVNRSTFRIQPGTLPGVDHAFDGAQL